MWYHDVVQTQLAVLTTVSQERRVRLLELQLRHTVITLERNTCIFSSHPTWIKMPWLRLLPFGGVVSSCENRYGLKSIYQRDCTLGSD